MADFRPGERCKEIRSDLQAAITLVAGVAAIDKLLSPDLAHRMPDKPGPPGETATDGSNGFRVVDQIDQGLTRSFPVCSVDGHAVERATLGSGQDQARRILETPRSWARLDLEHGLEFFRVELFIRDAVRS